MAQLLFLLVPALPRISNHGAGFPHPQDPAGCFTAMSPSRRLGTGTPVFIGDMTFMNPFSPSSTGSRVSGSRMTALL